MYLSKWPNVFVLVCLLTVLHWTAMICLHVFQKLITSSIRMFVNYEMSNSPKILFLWLTLWAVVQWFSGPAYATSRNGKTESIFHICTEKTVQILLRLFWIWNSDLLGVPQFQKLKHKSPKQVDRNYLRSQDSIFTMNIYDLHKGLV